MVRFTAISAALSLVALAAAPAGCTRTPLVAPSGTVITLISTTNMLPINGSADIVAVLVENGTTSTGTGGETPAAVPSTGNPVHNGTLVSFSTTLGRVEPAEAKTANGGQVTVKLIADGRSGVATVTAYSGGASKTLTVNIGAAAAARILLSATPQTLPFAGGTATVSASVQDQQGNPIAGVPVTFSTNGGTLGRTTAVTDSSGFATTTVTTNANATITATAGGGTGTASLTGTVDITVLANTTISLSVPSTLISGSPGTFTVNVGTAVPATDVTIDFGDGSEPESLGGLTSSGSTSHVYGEAGAYNVVAFARFTDGTTKQAISKVIVQGWQASASCGNNVAFGSTSTLTANVTPATSVLKYFWNFGPGEGTAEGNPTSHAWESRGTKTVTVTVTPLEGRPQSAMCQLIVF